MHTLRSFIALKSSLPVAAITGTPRSVPMVHFHQQALVHSVVHKQKIGNVVKFLMVMSELAMTMRT